MVSSPYRIDKGWSVSKIIKSQIAFVFIHLLVVASLVFFHNKNYTWRQIILLYAIFAPIFFSWKIFMYYLRKVLTPELVIKNYVLIGRNRVSEDIRKYYLINPQLGYRFKAYLDLEENENALERIRLFSARQEVHEIFCCTPNIQDNVIRQLVNFGLDSLIKVKILIDSGASESIRLDKYDRLPAIDLSVVPLDESINQFQKRFFDLLFSTLVIVTVMSWLAPLIALLIKLDSKGPVFFVQERSGRLNKSFFCFKFRSMKTSVEANEKQATKNDPRITKLGAFLRKSSIDELPQFFNVFLGDMSVVGPRPHMLKHTEEYSKLIEKFMGRHYVKPGITGLAQCMGYRGETQTLADMENRVRLDRYYIENWSFWLDIKIIFLTVVSLIRGSDKAY
jgi:Undecaprenyl-phosphate glucose phosphotransferase